MNEKRKNGLGGWRVRWWFAALPLLLVLGFVVTKELNRWQTSPMIQRFEAIPRLINGTVVVKQQIIFTDAQGDAVYLNVVLEDCSANVKCQVKSAPITNTPDAQKMGAVHEGSWTCFADATIPNYTVKLRYSIVDQQGNLSPEERVSFECRR
jgi:hypothetical protein